MALPLVLLRRLAVASPAEAWAAIFDEAWRVCSPPLSARNAGAEVTRRDTEIVALDLFLATVGWDLWAIYEAAVTRTAKTLIEWWAAQPSGRAVLILDGLSLREVPWIVHGATTRGFRVHAARVTAAELPPETTPFAKALGFAQRSSLESKGTGATHVLPGARTESGDLPWLECEKLISAEPRWVFWHHWPDSKVHELSSPGQGIGPLAADAVARLNDDAFWSFVDRLTTGRRLIITSDHGYAASGLFSDTADEQGRHLRDVFQAGRSAPADDGTSPWVPPVEVTLASAHGRRRYALGRRKWKTQGGYPTLTHGGLTVLEVASPFVEMSGKE